MGEGCEVGVGWAHAMVAVDGRCGVWNDLNTHGATYPGTDLPVTYHLAVHHSEAAA